MSLNSTSPIGPPASPSSFSGTDPRVGLLFIDPTVENYQALLPGVAPNLETIVLDAHHDGLLQITQTLADRDQIASVHILSHGFSGGLHLGNSLITVHTLEQYRPSLQSWRRVLTPEADILFYGCNTGAAEAGDALLTEFAALTGADIAASDDLTGTATLGGDWDLEVMTGLIDAPLAFQRAVLEAYTAVLAPFTPGNLVAVRVGTGVGALTTAATAVFLDEYTPAGTLVQSIAMPTADSGANQTLTMSGLAVSEGGLARSGNGQFLTLAGYDAVPGTATIATTASATVNRIVARVAADGMIDTSTRISDGYNTGNVRSAVTNDGTAFWVGGAGGAGTTGGTRYVPLGNLGPSTQIATDATNTRVVSIVNNQLYTSAGAGAYLGISTVGTGLPTTAGQTTTLFANSANAYGFVLLDRDAGVAGVDTLYLADQFAGSGLQKFSFDGATWTARGAVTGALTGLTGAIVGPNVVLYATRGTAAGNELVTLTDTAAFNAAITGAFTSLATTPANTVLRGLAFAPVAANVAPIVTLAGTAPQYAENQAPVILANTATVIDADSANLDTGTLTARFTAGGIPSDRLTLSPGGTVTLNGQRLAVGGTEIGTFRGGLGTSEPLVITFNASATPALVQTLLRRLAYSNAGDALPATGSRTVEVVLTDGDGGTSVAVTRTIAIITTTNNNDAPIIGNRTVLYDGTTNQLPTAPGAAPNGPWFAYTDTGAVLGGTATQTPGGGGTTLTTDNAVYAGYSNYTFTPVFAGLNVTFTGSPVNPGFPILDRTAGYTLSFSAQLNSESRAGGTDRNADGKDDRAGFSVIALSNDLRGIELGFWTDRIWAQDDGTTQANPSLEPDSAPADTTRTFFTQAEFNATVNTVPLTNYDLTVLGDSYSLFGNGVLLLTGRLRNYSAFVPPTRTVFPLQVTAPNPYALANHIFLGDGTPSAQASVRLTAIAITPNTALPAQTGAEEIPLVVTDIQIADVDASPNPVTVTLGVTNGTLTVNNAVVNGVTPGNISTNGTATVTLVGTVAQLNTTLANATGLTYQGATNFSGTETLTVTVADGGNTGGVAQTANRTKTITVTGVNDPPTVTAPATIVLTEDITTALTGISVADPDAAAGSVVATFTVGTGILAAIPGGGVTVGGTATNLTLSGTLAAINTFLAAGNLTYTPLLNSVASQTLGISLNDGGNTGSGGALDSGVTNVALTITPVNDAPSFSNGGNQTLAPGTTTPQTVANWATALVFGPADEAGQAVDDFLVTVTSDPNGIFTVVPDVANNGTLTYTPNGTAGTASIQVQLRDNGGTANGGVNTSTIATFTITIGSNSPPSFVTTTLNGSNSDLTVPEGSVVTLGATATDTEADSLTFTLDGTGAGTIAGAGGSLRTANPVIRSYDQDGSTVLTYAVTDGMAPPVFASRTVTVTNVAPTIVTATVNGSNGPITVDEGSTLALQLTATDPGADALTFTIAGTAAGTGGAGPGTTRTSTIVNRPVTDSGLLTLLFQVDDDDTSTTLNRTVTVLNVAPTAALGNGGPVPEGSPGTVSFTGPTDPSPDDIAAGFRYAYDFDNDGTFETGDGTYAGSVATATATVPGAFLASGPGIRTVRGRILDKDGGATDYTTDITIANVDPVITAGASITVPITEDNTPTAFALTLTATDGGVADALTWSILTPATLGTATVSATPTGNTQVISYVPLADTNGLDSFVVQVADGDGGTATITVTVTIAMVNDAPSFSILGDQTLTAGTTTPQAVAGWANTIVFGPANESGQAVEDFLVTVTSDPAGIFTVAPDVGNDGTLFYTPNGTAGTATVAVQLRDNDGTANGGVNTSAIATFTITVGSNTLPVFTSATLNGSNGDQSIPEGSTVTLQATAIDAEAGALTFTLDGAPAGTIPGPANATRTSFAVDRTYIDEGSITLPFTVTDSLAGTSTITRTLTITNVAPTITNGASTTIAIDEDSSPTPFALTLNATDPGTADILTWSILTPATNGTATVSATPTGNAQVISYTPTANVNGTDSFVVQVEDGDGGTAQITVNVTIAPINDPPTAATTTLTTLEDTAIDLDLRTLVSDPETLPGAFTFGVSNAVNGSVILLADGYTARFTPNGNVNGIASFDYSATDDGDGPAAALTAGPTTVTVLVTAVNDAPSFSTLGNQLRPPGTNTPQTVAGWANALVFGPGDEAGQAVADFLVTVTNDPNSIFTGVPDVANDGTLTFTPNGTAGTATLAIRLQDNGGTANGGQDTSAPVIVAITIGSNSPPNLLSATLNSNDGNLTISEGSTLTLQATATDLQADPLSFTIAGDPAGTITSAAGTTRTSTPVLRAYSNQGTAALTFTVSDGVNPPVSLTRTVTITNVAPTIANGDSTTVSMDEEGSPTPFALTLNATDPGTADILTWSILTPATNGTATVSATPTGTAQVISYVPTANVNGTDSFVVQVEDGDGGTAQITVNVTISPINDPPTTLGLADLTVDQGTANTVLDLASAFDDLETGAVGLTYTVQANSNPALVTTATITGSLLTLTYAAGSSGMATLTLRATDASGAFVETPLEVFVSPVSPTTLPSPPVPTLPYGLTHLQDLGGVDGVYQVGGPPGEAVTLQLDWVIRDALFDNEIGFFLVDDALGTVSGLAPDDPTYAQTAIASAGRQVVFARGSGAGAGVDITVTAGSFLVFYLVQDSTTAQWLGTNPSNQAGDRQILFSRSSSNPGQVDQGRDRSLAPGVLEIAWEDLAGGGDGDFNDLVIRVGPAAFQVPSTTGTTPVRFTLTQAEARFTNELGLFYGDDAQGQIGTLRPGDLGYATAALRAGNFQVVFARGQQPGETVTLALPAGRFIGWYLIQNASTAAFLWRNGGNRLDETPLAFFSFAAANPDGVDHFRRVSATEFGVEDLTGGGDRDFNDMVFSVQV